MKNIVESLNDNADSVRCITEAKEIAYKMWFLDEEGKISPILNDIPEAYNMPRQELPMIYCQNACIDVIRTRAIVDMKSMSGKKILGYPMKHNFDIDTEEDFLQAEAFARLAEGDHQFVFDIDGVIARFREDLNYEKALPNEPMIKIVNYLYSQGNRIVLFTARGYKTGVDWSDVTCNQLEAWGVKYHELKFGKPNADFYVDDKMLSPEVLLLFDKLRCK